MRACVKNQPKIAPNALLERVALQEVVPAPSDSNFGPLGRLLDPTWALLGASGSLQGLSWGTPGRSWAALGALLGCSWALLGALGELWGLNFFQKFAKICKKTLNFVSSELFGCSLASPERSELDFGPSGSRFWPSGERFGGPPSSNSIARFGKVLPKSWRKPSLTFS